MRPSYKLSRLFLFALVLVVSGCNDNDDATSDTPPPPPPPSAEPTTASGCEDAQGHPNRAAQEARGFVVACISDDEGSLHLRNVSSHVLSVTATQGVSDIKPAGTGQESGDQAARGVTGIGWTASRSHFVLPLSGSLIASGPGPVIVDVKPNLILTAQALSARYVAEWMTSLIPTRGQALVRKVQSCAETAARFATQDAYIADVLRNTLDTAKCVDTLSGVIREQGEEPRVVLPRARSEILKIAQPVAEDRLISFIAQVVTK